MAWLFGASHRYGAALSTDEGWDSGASTINYTATGGPFNERYSTANTLTRTLGVNAGTLTVGRWIRRTTVGTNAWWEFRDSGSVQCSFAWDASNHFLARNGSAGTIHQTSTYVLPVDTWVFAEVEVVFGNTGSMKMWIDGTQIINATGVDTTTTANNFANQWRSATGNSAIHEGALYIIDATGGAPTNTRLGPITAFLKPPSADGSATQYTPSTGSRFQCVDETPTPNDDTDYISDNTAGHKNSVALTANPGGIGTIFGVMHYFRERRDDAGPHTVRAGFRIGGTDYMEATETSPATYLSHTYARGLSPATGVAWTGAELNGAEHVVETVS